jgi:hypothetical protein
MQIEPDLLSPLVTGVIENYGDGKYRDEDMYERSHMVNHDFDPESSSL